MVLPSQETAIGLRECQSHINLRLLAYRNRETHSAGHAPRDITCLVKRGSLCSGAMPFKTGLFSLCVALATVAPLPAQQYTVKNIVFNGTTPYSQSSLEAASGLKPGDTIAKADLQTASQRLVDTGAFDDLQSSLDGPFKAVTVIFKVRAVDPSRMLTASFDNFVWFPPEELSAELQKLVPLFNGSVPEAGNQTDAIIAALRKLLSEKGVDATIIFEPIAPSPSQPLRLAEFRVTKPMVRFHSLTLNGVAPPFSVALNKLSSAAPGKPYVEGLVPFSLSNAILSVYKDAGYQASNVTSLTRKIASSDGSSADVDVSATVEPGELYHLSKLEWAGSPVMSSEGFAAEANLRPGDVASQKALLESLGKLEAAYHNKGYIDAVVTAKPRFDSASHEVTFTIAAMPGEQYKLRQVTPEHLSPAQRKDFDSAWKMRPGDIFDEGYAASFLRNNSALQSFNGYSAKFKTIADPDAHTVDLIMTFVRDGSAAP